MEVGISRLRQEDNDFKASLGDIMKPFGGRKRQAWGYNWVNKVLSLFREVQVSPRHLSPKASWWLLRKDAQGWPSAITSVCPQDHTDTNETVETGMELQCSLTVPKYSSSSSSSLSCTHETLFFLFPSPPLRPSPNPNDLRFLDSVLSEWITPSENWWLLWTLSLDIRQHKHHFPIPLVLRFCCAQQEVHSKSTKGLFKERAVKV